ncbi:alcohol dehydrogenase catalytic domain-containing protein [Shinella sp. 838]|uniref:zinc-dependent alcohol dehydrogenase n=1 Tax=Shinella sp. 838 TaxID=3038164 RepID=UPI00241561F5|nr:alcohol dehydrogenase catalytic domain-containing protein [Shinella sp. 838]MDG4674806.1 alcohol dehydrogenase catalytic domain-containing protein [Shinella sp. 838]
MKAAFYTGNKTFEIRDIEAKAPAADEVAIKVAYNGICGTDMHAYHGAMDARIGHNRIIGHEMSGTVAALGASVSGLAIGDAVAVRPLRPCGNCPACNGGISHICHNLKFLGLDSDGALQEQWNVPAYAVHKLPAGISLEHAALAEPVAVACHDVRLGRVKAGEDVLIIGGGPIGILIGMVAKQAGAKVTISEVNPHRLAIAEKLGFATLNPKDADVAATIMTKTGKKGADVVFEVSGTQAGTSLMTEAAASRGRIVMVAIHTKKPEVDLFRFFWRELELIGVRVYEKEDFDQAIDLIASGAIDGDTMITDIRGIDETGEAFAALDGNATAMKSLIRVAG